MFSGRFDTKPGEDGTYFIDRDGTHFRYILNYLRTGKLVLPDDAVVRKELLSEAEFYQIEGILSELKAQPFQDSVILSLEQRQILIDWLRETLESASDDYVLLYHPEWLGCFQFSLLLRPKGANSNSDKEWKLHLWRIH